MNRILKLSDLRGMLDDAIREHGDIEIFAEVDAHGADIFGHIAALTGNTIDAKIEIRRLEGRKVAAISISNNEKYLQEGSYPDPPKSDVISLEAAAGGV